MRRESKLESNTKEYAVGKKLYKYMSALVFCYSSKFVLQHGKAVFLRTLVRYRDFFLSLNGNNRTVCAAIERYFALRQYFRRIFLDRIQIFGSLRMLQFCTFL